MLIHISFKQWEFIFSTKKRKYEFASIFTSDNNVLRFMIVYSYIITNSNVKYQVYKYFLFICMLISLDNVYICL